MPESARCSQCGAEMPEEAPQGMCPACLLKLGLSGAMQAFQEPAPPAARQARKRRWAAMAAILGAAAMLAGAFALMGRRGTPPRAHVVRFSLPIPADAAFALSPDGTQLAYSAMGRLWIRPLEALAAREIPGTEGAAFPFWSPDSRYVGFWSEGKLKKIAAGGGPAQTVCDAPRFTGASWSHDGVIVFADGPTLYQVASAGGTRQRATELDGSKKEIMHRAPQFLPDGRHFLFAAISRQAENSAIYAGVLNGPLTRRLVLAGATAAAFAEQHLFAPRGGTLMAYPFDPLRMQIHGDPRPINSAEQIASFSAAGDVLAYRDGAGLQSWLTWLDRNGRRLGTVGEPAEPGSVSLSPDGKMVAVVRGGGLWLLDPGRGTTMRLTFGNGDTTSAEWSPDGTRVAFSSQEGAGTALFHKQVNGTGDPEPLLRSPARATIDSWSRDGRLILYDLEDAAGKTAIWQLHLSGDHKPMPVLRSDFQLRSARLSPDGRWMAYVSNETGRDEVYVASFPPEGKWAISATGGTEPQWREDTRELYFLSADRMLMAAPTDSVNPKELRAGIPRALFHTGGARFYAASAEGKRFLVQATREEGDSALLNVVLNWAEELR